MMEAVQTSETLVKSYQSTRRYNPEVSHLQATTLSFHVLSTTPFTITLASDAILPLSLNKPSILVEN
jgi:hypothetical protein